MSYARQMLDTYPRDLNLDAGALASAVDALSDRTHPWGDQERPRLLGGEPVGDGGCSEDPCGSRVPSDRQ
jgi:hypothetical protein